MHLSHQGNMSLKTTRLYPTWTAVSRALFSDVHVDTSSCGIFPLLLADLHIVNSYSPLAQYAVGQKSVLLNRYTLKSPQWRTNTGSFQKQQIRRVPTFHDTHALISTCLPSSTCSPRGSHIDEDVPHAFRAGHAVGSSAGWPSSLNLYHARGSSVSQR